MAYSKSLLDSYPLLFRQKNDELSDQHDPQSMNGQKEQSPDLFSSAIDGSQRIEKEDFLPVIDLQQIDSEKLQEVCTDWGIFRLVNHGIPSDLLTNLNEHAVEIFGLEFELKKNLFSSIPNSNLAYFWATPALSPDGAALPLKVKGDSVDSSSKRAVLEFNWIEGFSFFSSQLPHLQFCQHPLLQSFRALLEEYGKHLTRVGSIIFEEMTRKLNLCLSQEERESYLAPSTAEFRVYRYPVCEVTQQDVVGLDAHTDSSTISILSQNDVGGLQLFYEKENSWIDVKPIPDTLVVNLGDMMQAISDDRYKSVKHRVTVNNQKDRISFGYFVFPANDCLIRSSKYKPFTHLDYKAQNQRDLKSFGSKVGLSRFKVDKAP